MSDTISRWECPECGARNTKVNFGEHNAYPGDIAKSGMWGQPCPGVPVEHTYVLQGTERQQFIDALLGNVEAAAYPIFVGVTKAPWTSRRDDQPCPVEPITKSQVRNLALAALRAAINAVTEETT